ncbi:MAG: DNA polymerase domain-containing protein [Candidatus Thermoplasmatota archaeon]|nr:DNA polymerase domain-containing protein [Candidatus Thermoplasmatota archaeon]
MQSDHVKGWIIDAQLGDDGITMDVWLFVKDLGVHHLLIPWCATIHIHSDSHRLQNLASWLEYPEVKTRFSVGAMRFIRRRLSLDQYEMHDVLEIDMDDCRKIRQLANHIESRGDFHRYTLYSVDAHLAQRFFVEHNVAPFQYVEWDGNQFIHHEQSEEWPKLTQLTMEFDYDSADGFDTINSHLKSVTLLLNSGIYETKVTDSCKIYHDCSTKEFLSNLQQAIDRFDPDIIMTNGGDFLHFSMLQKLSHEAGHSFTLSRKNTGLQPRTMSRIVHSYGQVIRKDSYFPIHGRLHIDIRASFIVREGGLHGLFELARHSRQSPQDISRLSPGSVISAIQMRIAMEDGVLVPWKKNRPEDTKTAWELMMADRGGLYLDSKPGLYTDVIELDFASLFPSIIATRNISPETLNCACCQPANEPAANFLPLEIDLASDEFRRRRLEEQVGTGLFPITSSYALQVPDLSSHTCGRVHGFLGRVVAPIIERRRRLKQQMVFKGDAIDKQQNALKWLLVTCFGYTGYKNARFGRIEAHEAICAWAREILLQTIAIAEEEGWTVLHAIVDCVWIHREDVSRDEKQQLAKRFADRVTREIGIPLEYEDLYRFIGFLPSRMHGAGSLTKYWAYGDKGLKVRGIESRQHSTCEWIRNLQNMALQIMIDCVNDSIDVTGKHVQNTICSLLHEELALLDQHKISYKDLVITRRVTKTVEQFTVSTLTHSALLRADALGHGILPGRKARFIVVRCDSRDPADRVVLVEEIEKQSNIKIDTAYYRELAVRATWAILAPYGWTDEEILAGSKVMTLFDFQE